MTQQIEVLDALPGSVGEKFSSVKERLDTTWEERTTTNGKGLVMKSIAL